VLVYTISFDGMVGAERIGLSSLVVLYTWVDGTPLELMVVLVCSVTTGTSKMVLVSILVVGMPSFVVVTVYSSVTGTSVVAVGT